ncbi:MAG: hypothetical protein GTO45_06165 [Candidatus Aminicenantes bacterium]|nr:hypothetical protein [Candidatus Aminicenantes bacterium]NIM78408.1 hypothetical protein [Candidatus Aminicenantes bacterium]NIN17670.1 hypothetical protein [Candidatus Aminicenantes bacterium]NIN41546.1 hypothetical protein [Candidatus Aminicenantes bacterium]NIN84320.1 hypothetical protein [Candidatus Aminicenantes bacterium]
MSESEAYKVKIEGLGITLEKEVPKEIGDKVLVLIITGNSNDISVRTSTSFGGPLEQSIIQSDENNTKLIEKPKKSIREFLVESKAKRAIEKITAIGVFLDKHKNKKNFTKEKIKKSFQEASEKVTTNLPRDIKATIGAGWIAELDEEKGHYYVTNTGNEAVTNKFPEEIVKKSRGSYGGKKTKQKTVDKK